MYENIFDAIDDVESFVTDEIELREYEDSQYTYKGLNADEIARQRELRSIRSRTGSSDEEIIDREPGFLKRKWIKGSWIPYTTSPVIDQDRLRKSWQKRYDHTPEQNWDKHQELYNKSKAQQHRIVDTKKWANIFNTTPGDVNVPTAVKGLVKGGENVTDPKDSLRMRSSRWLGHNIGSPGDALGVGATLAGAGGLGYLAYKWIKKKRKENKENKRLLDMKKDYATNLRPLHKLGLAGDQRQRSNYYRLSNQTSPYPQNTSSSTDLVPY